MAESFRGEWFFTGDPAFRMRMFISGSQTVRKYLSRHHSNFSAGLDVLEITKNNAWPKFVE
jgi:hypothetical protein